jgi:hypothetical protein
MGATLPLLKLVAAISSSGGILVREHARRRLLIVAAIAFTTMTAVVAARNDLRDDLVDVPGSFTFVGNANGQFIPGRSARVTDTNGIVRSAYISDFDDLREFRIGFNSASADENAGSGAVQVVNIVWLGDSQPAIGVSKSGYQLPQPAEALRMRDWQLSGMDGGTLASRAAQDDADGPLSDEVSMDVTVESNAIGLAYGLGTLSTEQQVQINAYGSIMGDSYWSCDVENQIVGPKAGLVWRNRRGPWSLDMQSLVLLGFNSGQIGQSSRIGQDFIPGALNRLFYMRATYWSQSDDRQMFTPAGELRAQSRLRLTDGLSLRTTWSSFIIGNLLREHGELHGPVPHISVLVENENMLIHQFYCGVEYLH